jgi:serine/threonine protein kinase
MQMGKCNRDIKLENIMVVDKGMPLIKLCNFGLSKDRAADSSPATQAGSALFTAPEVLLNVQGRAYCGEAVDVWSCGVVLHMLLFGCHPFLSAADVLLTESEQVRACNRACNRARARACVGFWARAVWACACFGAGR